MPVDGCRCQSIPMNTSRRSGEIPISHLTCQQRIFAKLSECRLRVRVGSTASRAEHPMHWLSARYLKATRSSATAQWRTRKFDQARIPSLAALATILFLPSAPECGRPKHPEDRQLRVCALGEKVVLTSSEHRNLVYLHLRSLLLMWSYSVKAFKPISIRGS